MPRSLKRIFNSVPVLAGMLAAAAGTAQAQTAQNISIYTMSDAKHCRAADSATRVCSGPSGIVVVVSEDDLRETVSAGRSRKDAEQQPAAKTWFGPFNATKPNIEWRLTDRSKPPHAMIQRWRIADIEDEDSEGRPISKDLLVVTRLPPGEVCHVAYVDMKANRDAHDLAREAADTIARDFRCGADKVKVIGVSGRAVQLALP